DAFVHDRFTGQIERVSVDTWGSQGDGDCAGLFYPDLAQAPVQGRHLDYHWDGERVDLVRDATDGTVYRVV
ncbi:MAG TPA: hypothetical protein PKH39_19665, partial [Woeseiaceae bacterium]|nr:hypothetical protein [Woeseiaceae bacterium]